jgi:acetolactate synthase-1/2/3 large subunit
VIVSDIISAWLEKHALNQIFAVTGGGSLFLTHSISKNIKLKICYAHHEQGAAIAAEGWARATGKPGVAVLTLGPGATNAITGVAGAWMDSVPLLIFSGQSYRNQTVGNSNKRQNGIQEFNILGIADGFCKYSTQLNPNKDILTQLENCLEIANAGRPGPVWIEIPVDVQKMSVNSLAQREKIGNKKNNELVDVKSELDILKNELKKSKRPILLIGNGVRSNSNIEKISTMAHNLKIPVILSHNSYDFLSFESQINLGFSGIFGHRYANIIIQNCDLIISIGYRLSLAQTGYNNLSFGKIAKIFQIDIDPTELVKENVDIFKTIKMDGTQFIEELIKFNKDWKSIDDQWLDRCYEIKNKFNPLFHQDLQVSPLVNSYLFVDKFSGILEDFDQIVTDMGLSYQCTYQQIKLKSNNRLITNTGFAEMGWGLPGAIGVCLGSNKKTYCLTGDGGLMMNLQELATIKHHNLPIIVIIFSNKGYLTIKQSQEIGFNHLTGVDKNTGLTFPSFEHIAKAFDFNFRKVDSNSDIQKSLEYMKECDSPTIIELNMSIDQLQAPKAIPQFNEEFNYHQSLIENPFPFLSEEELTKIQVELRGFDARG